MAGNQNSGRKNLPVSVHLIRGNPSKKAFSDLKQNHVQWELVSDVPTCPPELDEIAREEWDRITPDLYKLGVIKTFDQGELAVYCQAYADWKYARRKVSALKEEGYVDITPSGYKQMSVWLQIANRAEERMRASGASFGFTPAARQRIQLPVAQADLFSNEHKEKAEKYF